MKKAVILLSGGLDSATCLGLAKSEGFECYALSFSYGQRHSVELEAAKKLAQFFDVKEHRIVNLDIGQFGGSALTDEQIEVPQYTDSTAIPITYVPARNTIFLAMALGFAEVKDASELYIGVSSVDYSHYPDCRPEYIEAFQQLANLATKTGVEGRAIKINSPLQYLTKAATIKLGLSVGVPYELSISCYQANPKGEACGGCGSCILRKKGFKEAGFKDPTSYIN